MAHPKAALVSTTDNTDTAPVQKEGGTAIGITDASTVTTGSPITKTFNLRDNANDGAVKRSRVVAINGGTQATPVGVTGVQTAKGSGTIAFDPGVAGHTIENGNGWIIRGWANYINNVSNTNSLREFVDTEAIGIKKQLKVHLPKVSDKITKIKLTEAINQIENLTKGKVVNEKQVLTLMRYYELIKEIKNVHES